MSGRFDLLRPQIQPPLDRDFRPAVLANRNFRLQVASVGVPFIIGLERSDGGISRYAGQVFPADHPNAQANLDYIERLVKFLLWQRGAFRLYVGGPQQIGEHIAHCYAPDGLRRFDHQFMGGQVYERPFQVQVCAPEEVPAASGTGILLGRHLNGCRIGFDLGASDRKVSAVVDGQVVYSEEVVWEPRKHADPDYHYQEILTALKTAAREMRCVEAIGGSSAGIFVDNRPMVASLFRSVPKERFDEVRNLFLRIRREFGVPLEVINDGDVTALAGSMSIGENGVLGIALGSSEAAGYIDPEGRITGWLSELAFAPIDYNPDAPVEEWSGDRGCGASYLSQACVFRLAPQVGIQIPSDLTDADRLKFVQEKLAAGHAGAVQIWESMGVFLGYALAHYADFYDIRHVLILGRCTSGRGGDLLLANAQNVLKTEFPELQHKIMLHLPDEKVRRVGQSVAAASLPVLD
jgi:predicted NBD/HSP70 family sugar kinase